MEIYKIEGRHDIEEKRVLETRARPGARQPSPRPQGQATKAFALRTRENEPRGPRRASLCLRLYVLRSLTVVVYGVNERNYARTYGTL